VGGATPTGLNPYILANRLTDFVRRTPCDVPFSQLNILRDGRVSLCCVDFNEEAVIADARTTPIAEIWAGNTELQRHRAALNGQDVGGSHPICQRCYASTALYADAPMNRAIQDMFRLKEACAGAVDDGAIFNRIRFELQRHGFDVADTAASPRLYDTGDAFVAAAVAQQTAQRARHRPLLLRLLGR
jgi:hypothetical protein